jgi:Pyruvate/2-oxoacid:ferredoxin oxidoreductase delta subunit
VLGQFTDSVRFASRPDDGLGFIDVAGMDPSAIRAAVLKRIGETDAKAPGGWKPWFPVIDYDRCTNCMQCLTFCLFDVYGVDGEAKISVQTQDNCKTDCPACSRVCPEAAILFPKYKSGPINGDVVREEDLKREAMKVDISDLLGGDIYGALRTRSNQARERFSTERDESKALLERKRCLKKLQKDLDIPNEVLMTLPSAGDIEERARRAREKAERRKTRSQSMMDQQKDQGGATTQEWGI